MGVLRGSTGVINGVDNTDKWEIKYQSLAKPIVTSGSQNGNIRIEGMKDWKGAFSRLGHTPATNTFPGESFTFLGNLDGNAGVPTNKGVTGLAIATKFGLVWQQEENGYLNHVVEFAGNYTIAGVLTLGAVSAAKDVVVPTPFHTDSLCIDMGGADQGDVRFAQLTIECDAKPYGSCKTAGWKKRIAGPIDFEMAYGCYIADPSALPTMDSLYVAKMYVTDSTYWQLTWAKIEEVEILWQTTDYTAAVVTARMGGESGGVIGSIIDPAGTPRWPV